YGRVPRRSTSGVERRCSLRRSLDAGCATTDTILTRDSSHMRVDFTRAQRSFQHATSSPSMLHSTSSWPIAAFTTSVTTHWLENCHRFETFWPSAESFL